MNEKNNEEITVGKLDFDPDEEERYLSEFEQEKLEDFRKMIQHLVDESLRKGDPILEEHRSLHHLNRLNVNELGEKEHRIFKLYRKFTGDYEQYEKPGWPGVKDHPFIKAIREYEDTEIEPLMRTKDVPEPVRSSKQNFSAYLLNEALELDAKYRDEQHEKAKQAATKV